MRFIVYSFALSLLFFWACESAESGPEATAAEAESALLQQLPGTWESVSLKVFVNTFENSDSSYIIDIQEKDWERTFGMRPIKMVFQPNEKYYREHRSSIDTLIYDARGIWSAEVDTLRMVEEDGASYRYRVKVRNGLSEFRAFVDWDGDGVEDDEYIEIKRLVSIETQ